MNGDEEILQEPDPQPRPIDHLTLHAARDAPALIAGGEMLSFADLEAQVGALAAWLAGQGVRPGERVASWLPKTKLACLFPLAAARIGAVHVPINPVLKRAQAAYILADSRAVLLVTQEARAASFDAGDVPVACSVFVDPAWDDQIPLGPSDIDPQSLAALLYTSGSTGWPKGVMLSHANLWLGAISVAHYLHLAPGDRTLCVLPFAFDYGQNQLLSTWAAGACAVPLDYLTPRDVVKAVEKHGITTLAGVPPLWVQLAEAAWPEATTLRRLTNSGGALTEPLVRKLRGLFPATALYAMYGLTEAFRSTYLDPKLIDAHPTAIGDAIPFAEILIAEGELVHAGPLVALGYWRDPERTALRFRLAPAGSRYGGIAVWSGDTVARGEDGLLRFVGRADEMIKSAGNRISPTEVEDAVIASGAAVEAVAIGIPDARLGQAILLVARGDGSGEERLVSYLKRELPNFMQPARIVWRTELPRGPNGKLDRAGLKAELAA